MSKADIHSHSIHSHPIHLGRGGTATAEPAFTGALQWYEDYIARHAADDAEGRLVALHSFTEPWTSWEVHPNGSEVVLCISGQMTLHQEAPDGSETTVTLKAGDYAINAPGVWHTADVGAEATALFITPGLGTEHRPR